MFSSAARILTREPKIYKEAEREKYILGFVDKFSLGVDTCGPDMFIEPDWSSFLFKEFQFN